MTALPQPTQIPANLAPELVKGEGPLYSLLLLLFAVILSEPNEPAVSRSYPLQCHPKSRHPDPELAEGEGPLYWFLPLYLGLRLPLQLPVFRCHPGAKRRTPASVLAFALAVALS
jgi:hypothetical protein